jgi:formylglycine-generating enzyme required for sulfatase activity
MRRAGSGAAAVPGRRLGPAAAALVLAIAALAGCDDAASRRTVRLLIDVAPDLVDRGAIDAVRVTLTGSRTADPADPALCDPVTCEFPAGPAETLPVVVDFERGETYGRWAYLRVSWLSAGVERARRELVVSWPDGGIRELPVRLETVCDGRTCPDGEQCLATGGEGRCVSVPFPGVLDDPLRFDAGIPCWRADSAGSCPATVERDADAETDGETDVPDEADVPDVDDVPDVRCPPDDVGSCPEGMILVPAGPFVRGSDPGEGIGDEEPEGVVHVSSFCLDVTEVTNAAYRACVTAGACADPQGGAASYWRSSYLYDDAYLGYPVVNVRWRQAVNYCDWAGKRLPTEAEWEKACRGGCETAGDATCGPEDERAFPWGDAPCDCARANFNACNVWTDLYDDTDAVGVRPDGASPYCALDLVGNAREFVADLYSPGAYATCGDPCIDPTGPATGTEVIVRGGSFFVPAGLLRCADRQSVPDDHASAETGFRCAVTAP